MTEERKHAILFAATLLCARKLAELDSDKPSPAKVYAVNTAIEKAKFILDRIVACAVKELFEPLHATLKRFPVRILPRLLHY